MSIEAMKQALEALEANEKLINGEEDCFGLEGAMDGYYSGCFDVDGVNKLTDQAITSLRQAIAEAEKQEPRIPYFEVMSNALELYEFDQSTENHGALMQAVHNYVAEKEKPDDGYCQACDGDMCTARKGCVALDNPQPKVEQEPVAWRYKPNREDNPRWEYTTQHPLDMGDGYLRPTLVEYCKCIEPLYAKEKPKLMLEKFREMEALLDDAVQQKPATKEQIREAIVFNLPLYTTPQPAQKPLTDEEIAEIFLGLYGSGIHHDDHVFARAIEAAHGIGEKK